MASHDLLIEIGTEELPPKALLNLSNAFTDSIAQQLDDQGLAYSQIIPYATPRRIALLVKSLVSEQSARTIIKFGPAIAAAFTADGLATKAAEGFARSCGVSVAELDQEQEGKVTKLVFRAQQQGSETASLIPNILNIALSGLPVPKRMRWGSTRDEFVRPVQWVVLMYGASVIDAVIMGQRAGNITYGHRFQAPDPISLNDPADYETELLKAFVIPDFSKRRSEIKQQIEELASSSNSTAIIDEALLDEVTALVENPVALIGNFDVSFLEVPKEALISSMKEHQKCFHLLDASHNIQPFFITVSNLQSKDPAQVVAGNEKVIRPRLADAAFFFNQDRRHPLSSRLEKLKTVVFQQDLGTVADKSARVVILSEFIAQQLAYDEQLASRAAQLGKCDLVTSMVYEFADLQGIMGYYYAIHDGEPEEVAFALNEQYMPRFAGDQLPVSNTGCVLALAERLDTLAGLFGLGQPPTGSKDPFALRRAALGIVRIVIEKKLALSLKSCIDKAFSGFVDNSKVSNAASQMEDFIFDRLRAYYADQGIRSDIFQSVDAVRPDSPLVFDARIKAVDTFTRVPEALALAAINKRVSNILLKSDIDPTLPCNELLLIDTREVLLFKALNKVQSTTAPLLANSLFADSLKEMASLQPHIDAFFEHVMVNADDPAIKQNRLALLNQLRLLFLQIADISLLQNV